MYWNSLRILLPFHVCNSNLSDFLYFSFLLLSFHYYSKMKFQFLFFFFFFFFWTIFCQWWLEDTCWLNFLSVMSDDVVLPSFKWTKYRKYSKLWLWWRSQAVVTVMLSNFFFFFLWEIKNLKSSIERPIVAIRCCRYLTFFSTSAYFVNGNT